MQMHSSPRNFNFKVKQYYGMAVLTAPRLPGTLAGRKLGPWHDTCAGFERKAAGGRRLTEAAGGKTGAMPRLGHAGLSENPKVLLQ
jgi:hypothetical protein